MTNEKEKAAVFLDSINRDADTLCKKIRSDVDRYVETELEKARAIAHEQVKTFRKSEIDRLNEENNAGFSELEAEETKKLLDRRTQITDEVFEKAVNKLKQFTESAEYPDFLKRSITEIKAQLGEDAVIILRPEDEKYGAELSDLCAEIKYDPSISLGGCRAENLSAGIIADDTLEARLQEEKSRFYRTSGMTITL